MYKVNGFDWDKWNKAKNWIKHRISPRECEEVFFNEPKIIYQDLKHSFTENRFGILGKTDGRRRLHVIFTAREGKIRVISARDQNKKERKHYESKEKGSK